MGPEWISGRLPAMGKQIGEVGRLGRGHAGEYVLEVIPGIEPAEDGRAQQGQQDGYGLAAADGAHVEEVSPAHGYRPHIALGGIVGQRQTSVFEKAGKHLPLVQGIATGIGQRALGQKRWVMGA